jgi:hypothetical protein
MVPHRNYTVATRLVSRSVPLTSNATVQPEPHFRGDRLEQFVGHC